MNWILYIGLGIPIVLFGSIFLAFAVAAVMDWRWQRKNRLFIELRRDHNQPRRPAAK